MSTKRERWRRWTSSPGDDEAIKAPLDFIGINLYTRTIAANNPDDKYLGHPASPGAGTENRLRLGGLAGRALPDDHARPPRLRPPDLRHRERLLVLDRAGRGWPRAGQERIDFYKGYIGQVGRAIDEGADVRGYYAWSLLDNFEWAMGYSQRFGLVYVDFENEQKRFVKDSGYWYRDLIAAGEIEYDETLV